MIRLYYVVLLCLVGTCMRSHALTNDDEFRVDFDRAHILVHLDTDEHVVVAGNNMTITITLANVGGRPAEDIWVTIPQWPKESFELITAGNPWKTGIEALESNEKFEYDILMTPKQHMTLSSEHARVKVEYIDRDGDTKIPRVGYGINLLNGIEVISKAKFDRMHTSTLREMVEFFVVSAVAWAVPFILWIYYSTKNNFVAGS